MLKPAATMRQSRPNMSHTLTCARCLRRTTSQARKDSRFSSEEDGVETQIDDHGGVGEGTALAPPATTLTAIAREDARILAELARAVEEHEAHRGRCRENRPPIGLLQRGTRDHKTVRRDGELGTHQRQPGHPIVIGQSNPCRHFHHIRGRMPVIGIPERHAKCRPDRVEDFSERERDRRVLPTVSRRTFRSRPSDSGSSATRTSLENGTF